MTHTRGGVLLVLCLLLIYGGCSGADTTALSSPEAPLALDTSAMESALTGRTFSFTLDAFITSCNSYYTQEHPASVLPPAAAWEQRAYPDALLYQFRPGSGSKNVPTLSVYLPSGSSRVQEITLDFSEHGYTPKGRDRYRELCVYTLKTFFPAYDNETLEALSRALFDRAYEHLIPEDAPPEPNRLYRQGDIGIFPYFRIGTIHISLRPITPAYETELKAADVALYDISDLLQRKDDPYGTD